jgi:hypothetical protein
MMKPRFCLSLLLLVGFAGTAHAGPLESFEKFFGDLTADPAAANQFVSNAEMVILPRADGIVMSPKSITASDLVGDTTGATVTFKTKKLRMIDDYQSVFVFGDVDATLAVGKKKTVKHLRFSAELDRNAQDAVAETPTVAMFSLAIPDKQVRKAAKAGTLPAPAAFTEANADNTFRMNYEKFDKDDLADMIANGDSEATLVGSQAGETYRGKKGAKKIRAWKIDLAPDGPVYCGRGYFCALNLKGTLKSGTTVTYRAIIYYAEALEDFTPVSVVQLSIAQ